MFIKSNIRKVTIAFEKVFYSEMYLALGKVGIIHLSRFHERDSVMDAGLQNEETRAREMLSGTEYVLNALSIKPEEADVPARMVDTSSKAAFVSKTKRAVERAVRFRTRVREASDAVALQEEYAEALGKMGIDPATINRARLVNTIFGTVDNAVWRCPLRRTIHDCQSGQICFRHGLGGRFFGDASISERIRVH